MTRFARAKGSKSSNERTPEDSTPWEVMKEQLLKAKTESEESKKRQEAEQQRIDNYENFLKERKVQKRKATWCDFPESQTRKDASSEPSATGKKKKKPKIQNGPEENNQINDNVESPMEKTNKKKKKNKNMESVLEEPVQNESPKHKNKKKQQANASQDSFNGPAVQENSDNLFGNPIKNIKTDQNGNMSNGQPKNKKNKKSKKSLANTGQNQQNTNKQDKTESLETSTATNIESEKQNSPKKKKKFVEGKPIRRKEINDQSFQLIINSKEVELVRFDGFPIMKKDADRLEELKTSMIKKGIPKSEVQRTIKLERRRAEKALARLKRDVCYNCRKGGHVLSDCPELKSKIPGADGADGVCFKCGSTEHRQFECKVQKDKEFRFATCFICKEPGHIARQCPDNPKGLYPNGGNCKLCGDVTHLRKDCPTISDKKEESNIKLQTLDASEDIEDVGQQAKPVVQETSKKPKKIKF